MAGERPWSERLTARPEPGGGGMRRLAWPAAAAGALVAVLVVALVVAFRDAGPAADAEVPSVPPRNVLVEVGELRSSSVTPVHVKASGEISWLIEEGAVVGSGDVVARIDDNEARTRFEEKERETVPLKSDVERREQELEAARALSPLRARLAEIELELARWKLEDLSLHPTPDELAEAGLDLRVATLKREKAARDHERTQEVAARGLATDIELRQKRLAALDAEAEAELARLRLDVVKAGPAKLSLESRRLDVEKARLAVERQRFASEADVVIADKGLETARAYLSQGERELDRRRERLARYEVKAGAPGRVSFPEVWKYTKAMSRREVGETISRGHMLCQIVDPSRMEAVVQVNEADALSLEPGLAATVRPAALPGVEIPGQVKAIGFNAADKNEKLGHLALTKAGKAGVSVVEVRVALDGGKELVDTDGSRIDLGSLRGGHTVTVEIELGAGPAAADDGADAEESDAGEDEAEGRGGVSPEPEGKPDG